MKDATLAIHAGFQCDPVTKSVAVPIYQNVAYEFDSAQHAADLFNLEVPGNIYSRIMNPTNDVLEKRMAALEGGIAALVLSSGSAAITAAILALARSGDNIVATPQLYGGTYTLLAHMLPGLGIKVTFAENDTPEAIEKAIDQNTKIVFCESIGNPAGNIIDIAGLAEVAHRHHIPLMVDNTVASPVLCKPIQHGADIVVHSLTKYVGGHGNSLGGVIVDAGKFPWHLHPEKFACLTSPEPAYHGVVYTETFGDAAFIARARTVPLRNTGAALSPMNAFLILQGLETLTLRMKAHVENTLKVAEFLQNHPAVSWVNYAGLPGHRHHELAIKYMQGRPSGILSFGLKGGFAAGEAFYDALKLFKRLVNIGDARSLACHPASTTHRQLNDAELLAAGVSPEMIRLSVGIEDIEDILNDLIQALEHTA
ncbi:O-acetylhomoserine sulfhydrylase [Pantoea sp. AS-PWVM4]|uniref:O-acetylhomoserine aminocarboxypropyltransferase/cysteine synthase family protein n=1 Tax=Pantoea sp. AS-PWVM4 TaxID=1332069 RepID=UPI0003AC8B29|nr:aminotransferase class I/II-fold pyridoxal phosphate-dependent enzyme [Pantoea sp. AS-PWVM4]ERK16248.1 O-acetylhomoserine sulfhydrylase [Pantoea sp. AS-PWVM4]